MEEMELKQAAVEGNISKLSELVSENPILLDKYLSLYTETPLHVAALAGKAEFITELLKLAPWLVRQYNSSEKGLSAVHMAAAKGHADVVSALLDIDEKLAFIGDSDGSTALHYAAYYGRSDVSSVLLNRNTELVKMANLRGETPLDIAVKTKQHDVKLLIEKIGVGSTDEDLLGLFVLKSEVPRTIETYSQNLSQSHDEFGANNNQMNSQIATTPLKNKKNIAKEAMLIVGVLIATVTFQALMSPPQSILKDGHVQGKSSIFFLACNSVSFFASCFGIYVSTREDPTMLLFWVSSSLVWAAASYICVLISIMNNKKIVHDMLITSSVMVVPNLIISMFFYSRSMKKFAQRINRYVQV